MKDELAKLQENNEKSRNEKQKWFFESKTFLYQERPNLLPEIARLFKSTKRITNTSNSN